MYHPCEILSAATSDLRHRGDTMPSYRELTYGGASRYDDVYDGGSPLVDIGEPSDVEEWMQATSAYERAVKEWWNASSKPRRWVELTDFERDRARDAYDAGDVTP